MTVTTHAHGIRGRVASFHFNRLPGLQVIVFDEAEKCGILVGDASDGPYYGAEDLPDVGNNDIHYFLVGKRRGNRQMCILREVMPPGSDTGDTSLSHDGEEGGVIVQGQVEVTVGDRVKVLGPGEAYYFECRTPHRFRNVGGDDAIIVSANTPATF